MVLQIIKFTNALIVGLMAGTLWGLWLGCTGKLVGYQSYVELQQQLIRAFNVLMPLLGMVAIMLTLASAILQRGDKTVLVLLLVAAALCIASGVITRFGNQPINKIVMTWNPKVAEDQWTGLRDRWTELHVMRTVAMIAAFCLVLISVLRRS